VTYADRDLGNEDARWYCSRDHVFKMSARALDYIETELAHLATRVDKLFPRP